MLRVREGSKGGREVERQRGGEGERQGYRKLKRQRERKGRKRDKGRP